MIHRDQDGSGFMWQWMVAMVVLGSMAAVALAQENPVDKIGPSEESITKEDSTTDSKSGIEAVLDHIEQSARETGDQMAKTIQKMRDVQSRVKKTDTGRETQQLQKQILSDLDSLIQATRQQQQQRQQQSNPQQQPSPQQQESPQQQPSDQQQPSPADQSKPDGRRSDGQESATQTSQAKAAASQAAQRKVIMQQVWGHLPERLRERVLNMKDDRYLPKYEGLIRRYFETLAEKRGGRSDG